MFGFLFATFERNLPEPHGKLCSRYYRDIGERFGQDLGTLD